MSQAPDTDYVLVGKIAVQRGWITREQLESTIHELSQVAYARMREGTVDHVPELGELLVQKGLLDSDALRDIQLEIERMVVEPVSKTFGKYTLLRELGRGGMSVVWEAYDNERSERVALKFLTSYRPVGPPGQDPVDEETLRRFYREAQAAAKLTHPNIVRVVEVGVREGVHYITMDYIEGMTLDESLAVRQFPQRQYLRILHDIARALHHAHQQGILHRDVKPGNILVDRTGRGYIMDFGLARDIWDDERLTLSGIAIGTPSYMSPEHAQGSKGKVDPRSDLYSLGAVMYEVLTGRPPFLGNSPMEVMLAVVQDEPEDPRGLSPEIPAALEAICLHAMQKDPERRYPDTAAFADEVNRYLEGERIRGRVLSRLFDRLRGGIRRRGVAVVGVVALALGAAGYWMHRRVVRQERIEHHLREAAAQERRLDFPSAVSEYDLALAWDPKDARALRGRADCGRESLLARECRPFFQSGIEKYSKGDWPGAIEDLSKATDSRALAGSAYYFRSLVHERLGRMEEATRDLERALAAEPQNPIFRAHAERGRKAD